MSAVEGNEMEGYEALVSELRANPPVAPERLRQRVLEGAPAPRRQRSRKRRLVMVVVPLAAALAVGGAFVHGFLNSGSTPTTAATEAPRHSLARREVVGGQSGAAKTAQATSSGSEFAPATQTQSKSLQQYGLPGTDSIASGSTPLALAGVENQAVTIPRNRLVHAVASLQVGVTSKDLSAKTNEASQIVGSFGGYAQ